MFGTAIQVTFIRSTQDLPGQTIWFANLAALFGGVVVCLVVSKRGSRG